MAAPTRRIARRTEPWRPLRIPGLSAWISGGLLVVVAGLALLAPWLWFLDDPNAIDTSAFAQTPSLDHLLGTDVIGRDILARVVWGARVSLFIAGGAVVGGFVVGGSLGIWAGYRHGRAADRVLTATTDVLLAFPALLVALALVAFLSPPDQQTTSVRNVAVALAALSIPTAMRVSRSVTIRWAQADFVTAARGLGAHPLSILRSDIVANVLPALAAYAPIAMAQAVITEGALSFLGLSVESPTATWGGMINEGRTALESQPHITIIPCAVMFAVLLALNSLGEHTRRRASAGVAQM